MATSNGVDFQHLRALHGLPAVDPDAVRVGEHSIEYRIETPDYLQQGLITGVNTFSQHLAFGGGDVFMLFSGAPIAHGHTMGFYAYGVRDTGRGGTARRSGWTGCDSSCSGCWRRTRRCWTPSASARGVLVASDRHLARFFKYVREFPRAVPPDA